MKSSRLAVALAIAAVTVVGARAAHADDADDLTPPGAAPAAQVAPPMFSRALTGNNLRVGVNCAYYFATPETGLNVSVDGALARFADVNGVNVTSYDKHGNESVTWEPTDVSFDVAPGHHHITLNAPGCAADEHDVDIAQFGPTFMSGRLAIDEPELMGAVGSPDGLGFTVGYYQTSFAAQTGTTSGIGEPTAYSSAGATLQGVMVGTTFERRHLAVAVDMMFGLGSTTGTMQQAGIPSTVAAYNDSIFDSRVEARVGYRLPMRSVELAAGTGIGVDIAFQDGTAVHPQANADMPPTGGDFDAYVPLWASLTFKPTCGFGVQASASYDVRPTDTQNDDLSIMLGVVLQPSAACREPVGVTVR
jgi:hypothetical protein